MSYLPKDPVAAYKRIKRDDPQMPAYHAWRWAKSPRDQYDWKPGRGSLGIARTDFERDGLNVTVEVSYDDSPDPRVSQTDVDTGIRNPRFRYHADGYNPNRSEKYLELESGTTVSELAGYYNGKGGMSKNVAWEYAREALQEQADAYMRDDFALYVVTARVHLNGMELGLAALHGSEEGKYDSAEDVAEDVLRDYDLVGEAMAEARERLVALKPSIERVLATV